MLYISIYMLLFQTYAIHHRGSNEVEVCTYVCEVYYDGPAYIAGMRPGTLGVRKHAVSSWHVLYVLDEQMKN